MVSRLQAYALPHGHPGHSLSVSAQADGLTSARRDGTRLKLHVALRMGTGHLACRARGSHLGSSHAVA